MAKKWMSLLLALAMAFSLCACGGEKTSESQEVQQTEDKQPETTTVVETTVPEATEPPVYLEIIGGEDGMFWGYYEDVGYVLDSDLNLLFTLPEGRSFTRDEDAESCWIGDYAMITDGGVIDREGNLVFDVSESEFDKIYFPYTLDVGYLLCSVEVNTFEETGTHYYAYNVKDGTSFRLEGEFIPELEWYCYYLGNGLFVQSLPNGGFDTNHYFYNLLENRYYQGYLIDENGEQVYKMPSIAFWPIFKASGFQLTLNNDTLYYMRGDQSMVHYNMRTGVAQIVPIQANYELQSISNGGDLGFLDIVEVTFVDTNGESHRALFDQIGQVLTLMDDYQKYKLLDMDESGNMLLMVTNQGGGQFITVVEPGGGRVFEPISLIGFHASCDDCFVIESDEGLCAYDWEGTLLLSWEKRSFTFGENSMLYEVGESDARRVMLMNFSTGVSMELDPNLIMDVKYSKGFCNGRYMIFNYSDSSYGWLMDEDGNISRYQLK